MNRKTAIRPSMIERDHARALYDAGLATYEETLKSFQKTIRRLLESNGFTPSIKYRVKRFEAYYEKLRRNHNEGQTDSSSAISDILGLRIVCPFLEDIETIKNLITNNYDVTETDWKAAQHSFREFGYDSVHLLVKLDQGTIEQPLPGTSRVCEVQLRTILQDAWAEVEHELVYKSDISIPNESIRRKLASLNATLTLSDVIFQEIRDYQKAIRLRGQMRQQIVAESLDVLDIITLSHHQEEMTEGTSSADESPAKRSSKLEKTMLLALDAHSGHDLDTAIKLYGELLGMRLQPDIRSMVYNHRGMAYFAQGECTKAINDFSKAIRYNPKNARGFTNRGLCYRLIKNPERALSDFATAISIDPLQADAYFGKAQTYREMGQHGKAIHHGKKSLELNPNYQPAIALVRELEEKLG